MYYYYVEIEYVATSFSPARTDLALKLLRQKHNRKETRTIHIGILYLYSVETDFNEQE